jgi:hypothetical protein
MPRQPTNEPTACTALHCACFGCDEWSLKDVGGCWLVLTEAAARCIYWLACLDCSLCTRGATVLLSYDYVCMFLISLA